MKGDESEGVPGLNGRDRANTEPVDDARITALETMIATLSGQVAALTTTNGLLVTNVNRLDGIVQILAGQAGL